MKLLAHIVTLDLLTPFLNRLEGFVVSTTMIPNASRIPDRKVISDYDDECPQQQQQHFDHSKWDSVLKRHVMTTGITIDSITNVNEVDYDGIGSDPDFDGYLQQLDDADVTTLHGLDDLAFWMNAYNALCISLIVQYEKKRQVVAQQQEQESTPPPLASINELSDRKGAVWDKIAGRVGGIEMSLNDIEHDRLRKAWDEPAIHACIVCASASCPNLSPEAFVPHRLREQMAERVRSWLQNDTKGIKFSSDTNRLELSRIFLWFASDFGGWKGLRDQWLPQYLDDDDSSLMDAILQSREGGKRINVQYFPYSWVLNQVQSTGEPMDMSSSSSSSVSSQSAATLGQ